MFADNEIAQSLRMRRAQLRQTQKEAAEVIGVHPQTYSMWERGVIRPSPDRQKAIDNWMGTTEQADTAPVP